MPECYNRSIWKGRLLCSPQLAKGYRLTQPQRKQIFLNFVFRNLVRGDMTVHDYPVLVCVKSLSDVFFLHTGKIAWKRCWRQFRNDWSRGFTRSEDLAQQQDFWAWPPRDWLQDWASLQPGEWKMYTELNAEVNYCSGVQSYCPSNLKYSKDGYNSLHHHGNGEILVQY